MNICVYGAASNKIDDEYIKQGEALGVEMAKRGHSLVFGAGANGLMGAVSRGVYSVGGVRIIGIVPSFFTPEGQRVDGLLFENCDELIFTKTMRERKQLLEDRSDAYIITPGGIGTLDEYFEMLTLKNLGQHTKPLVILNTLGYYDGLLSVLKDMTDKGFVSEKVLGLCFVCDSINEALDYIEENA